MTDHKALITMINQNLETLFGKAAMGQFRFPDDAETLQRHAKVARDIGQPVLSAWVLSGIAVAHTLAGNFAEAEVWYRKALVIFEDLDDCKHRAAQYNNLGEIRRMAGKWYEALAFYEQALALANQCEDDPAEVTDMTVAGLRCAVYLNLGIVYVGLRRVDEAVEALATSACYLEDTINKDKSKGSLAYWVELNRTRAEVALLQGDITQAWSMATLAEESAHRLGHQPFVADIALTKGHIASRDADHPIPSSTYFAAAREAIQQLGHDMYLARFLLTEAHYQLHFGDLGLARQYASEALALCQALGLNDEAAYAQTLLG